MHPADRLILSTGALAELYDPGDDRVSLVNDFAHTHGLSVREVSRARHDVVLDGTTQQLSRAFGVTLRWFESEGTRYYAYDERVRLPRALRSAAEHVLGLENIPTHRTHAVAARRDAPRDAHADVATLERQYGFPTVDARGRRIALLEFGGGFSPDDIAAYAGRLGIAEPRVTPVSVRGATGQPVANAPLDRGIAAAIARDWKASLPFSALKKQHGNDLGAFMASMEVTMDIELALALGGGAAVDVYFAPSGVDGWRRALYAAVGLPVGGADGPRPPAPTVISASWGDSESVFGPEQLEMIERTLIAVRRAGVAVCCSSGDSGSVNSPPKPGVPSIPNVNFPASSPSVLACGGTRLLAGGPSGDSRPEVAWDERAFGVSMATGGGVSGYFKRPKAQSGVTVRPAKGTWRAPGAGNGAKRAVPDVSANAALSSGPAINFAGEELVGFGTSAAAPLCASLLARVSASVGHAVAGMEGWLYTADAKPCYRPVTKGNNDVTSGKVAFYRAGPGWNACTGLGALDGEKIVTTLIQTRKSEQPRK
jgi:kumamolisin